MRQLALIVAGGKGLRMGADLPKQFIVVGGKPILMHTLERFVHCDEIVLVLPASHQAYWQDLCTSYHCAVPHQIATGGETRYHSVLSGLKVLSSRGYTPDDVVAVHDGVRPLVSPDLVHLCFEMAAQHGAVLPYLEMVDSLRQVRPGGSQAVCRQDFVRVQTPQCFNLSQLLGAYTRPYQSDFTDDASVWECAGLPCPQLVRSNIENIKVTTPLDLILAEHLLQPSSGDDV